MHLSLSYVACMVIEVSMHQLSVLGASISRQDCAMSTVVGSTDMIEVGTASSELRGGE